MGSPVGQGHVRALVTPIFCNFIPPRPAPIRRPRERLRLRTDVGLRTVLRIDTQGMSSASDRRSRLGRIRRGPAAHSRRYTPQPGGPRRGDALERDKRGLSNRLSTRLGDEGPLAFRPPTGGVGAPFHGHDSPQFVAGSETRSMASRIRLATSTLHVSGISGTSPPVSSAVADGAICERDHAT